MREIRRFRLVALTGAMLALAGTVVPVRAQDADDLKRGVARLSLMNGDVSVRRGDAGEWVAGVINAPLLTGDNVATGPNSRTEVQFDNSNVLRIGANAELHLTQIEYGRYQMDLARGVMTYRVLHNVNANIEIDTPSLSVRPSKEGSFRISVNEAGETEVTARGGDVEIFNPKGSQWLRNGQTMLAHGAAADPEFQVLNAGGMDEWDRWCDSRDRMMLQSVSSRYVGPGVSGTEDLDAAGQWNNVPEYGNVWHPTAVPADWAPYQAGRWVWDDWYGWTWVSSDPWGWAPYHYGRWFHHDHYGWCWYPGVVGVRHYWSPALVAFIGFGHGVGVGVGFGFGNIGWVPLAPYEVFHPWWGRGYYGANRFNGNVNITNVNVTNTYRNSRYANGVHSVGVTDFQNGRFNNVARLSGNQIQGAGTVQGRLPVAPSNNSMRFSDRQASVVPRTTAANTRMFRAQQPTAVQRMPMNGAGSQVRGGQPAAPSPDGNGWRRFGSPAAQPGGTNGNQQNAVRNERPATAQQPSNQGGWQRFGTPSGNGPAQRQNAPAPRQNYQPSPQQQNAPARNQYVAPSRQEPLRIAPPVVRERPSNSAPQQRQSAPSAPRQNAPHQSAPSNNGHNGGRAR